MERFFCAQIAHSSFCQFFIKKIGLVAETQFSYMPCLKSGVAYRVCKSSVSSSRLPAIYLQYIVGIPPHSILGALCGRRSRHFEYSEYRCQFPKKKIATTNFSREYRCYICWYFDLDNQYHPYICCTFRKHSSCQSSAAYFSFWSQSETCCTGYIQWEFEAVVTAPLLFQVTKHILSLLWETSSLSC